MSYVHLHFGSNPALVDHLVRHASAAVAAGGGERRPPSRHSRRDSRDE